MFFKQKQFYDKLSHLLPLVLVILTVFTGCSVTEQAQLFAMDTVITMELHGRNAESALAAATEELYRLDELLSIEGADSEIAALNRGENITLSANTAAVLRAALEIAEATGGAYDCTIQPVAQAWGWYDDVQAVPFEDALAEALALVGYEQVLLDGSDVTFAQPGMGIDLGGIAKGYSAYQLGLGLRENGVTSGCLSLGGNVRVIGSKPNGQPWVIGIADPNDPSAYLCTVSVTDCAVVTSGDYQRNFTEDGVFWHHILDPETGYSVKNGLRSVTIVTENDTLADGLSTALFVMGLEEAVEFWRSGPYDFEAVFLLEDRVFITEGLSGSFACQTDYEVISR